MSRLPSIATGKGHPLANGKGVQGGSKGGQGVSLPGTPTEGAQQDSNNGAAGGSRKSPSTIMRPRSTQVLSADVTRSALCHVVLLGYRFDLVCAAVWCAHL